MHEYIDKINEIKKKYSKVNRDAEKCLRETSELRANFAKQYVKEYFEDLYDDYYLMCD